MSVLARREVHEGRDVFGFLLSRMFIKTAIAVLNGNLTRFNSGVHMLDDVFGDSGGCGGSSVDHRYVQVKIYVCIGGKNNG